MFIFCISYTHTHTHIYIYMPPISYLDHGWFRWQQPVQWQLQIAGR
jgi:hypothetical protein